MDHNNRPSQRQWWVEISVGCYSRSTVLEHVGEGSVVCRTFVLMGGGVVIL